MHAKWKLVIRGAVAAFEQVFRRCAETSAAGPAELKDLSQVDTSALHASR